jgi:ferric-dicitrate binding protein FerR (iron transport regulator)
MEENMDVRIGRYLSGEMTDREREAFESELTHNQILKSRLASGSRIWKASDLQDAGQWDVANAWVRFSANVIDPSETKPKPVRRLNVLAIAATVLVLIGVYGLFFRNGSPEVYAANDKVIEVIDLKDGSKIYLNKNAQITVYPFTSSKRHIELKGEAFFSVASDPSRPFTVSCGNTKTEVVGTAFNIRQTENEVAIFVTSGKVIFASDENKEAAALTAGEAAVYKSGKLELVANPSPNINAWRTHDLRFIKMPLSSVVEDISNYFDQDISIENESSKSCPITIPITFSKPEINSVLKAVAASINADLVQEGNTYIIRGGRDCN